MRNVMRNVLFGISILLMIVFLFSWDWFRESPLGAAVIGVLIVAGLLSVLGISFLGARAIVTRKLGEFRDAEAIVWGIILLVISIGALVAVYYDWSAGYVWR